MFQTRCEYLKPMINVSTAVYSQRVANSKNNNTKHISATVLLLQYYIFFSKIQTFIVYVCYVRSD